MGSGKHVFKPRVERDYIGTYSPRSDGLKKAAGKAEFTDDITLKRKYPDMLYMRMLKSPYPHAKIKSIDSGAAEAHPGVVAVLRYDDPEVLAFPSITGGYSDAVATVSRAQAWTAGLFDRRVLGDHARWVGDELGIAIAATSEETVEEAMRLLKVEWEVLPFVLTVEDAIKPGAPIIHPEINPDSNYLPPEIETWGPDLFYDHGDFEKGFSEAEVKVEAQANFYNAEQGALEYWSGMVDWNNEDEIMVLSDSYCVDQTRFSLHEFFEVPLSKIRVVTPYQGGQHGRADTPEQYFFYVCAAMSKRTGRPVKYRQTRREHFHDTRVAELLKIRLGATKDGKITACEFNILSNQGAYVDLGQTDVKYVVSGSWFKSVIDPIPNRRAIARGVYTNQIPGTCMRSTGNILYNYILSIGIEALAEKIGMDPLEIYIKSLGNKAVGPPNPCLEEVLRKGAGLIGWEKRHAHGEGGQAGGEDERTGGEGGQAGEESGLAGGKGGQAGGAKKRGMGFASGHTWHVEHFEYRRGVTQVMIKLNPDGTVILNAPTVEVGTGSNHCAVLACAESLGVDLDKITWIYYQDTEAGLKDQVQSDSAVSYILGEAVYECGLKLKRQFLEQVSNRMGHDADELDMKKGRVFVKADPSKGMLIEEYFSLITLEGEDPEDSLVPPTAFVARQLSKEYDGNAYMATFAEVEVDTETGEVEVLKLIVCSDGGTIINPAGAEAQLAGGQCMGIGESLFEKMIYDERTGVPLNFNFIDYKFPTAADWPDVDPIPMEIYEGKQGVFGASGIGEGANSCTPGAISNAIYNALGIRVDGTGISPRDILKAIGKAGG